MRVNPATVSGRIGASVPPAITMSARPERIISIPYPIASLPDAHALTAVWTPAWAPNSSPTHRPRRSA